jgi:predicted TIM-barrel fold metal-dependent hydrolase
MYVDAHHHLWNLSAVRYPWLMSSGKERFFGDPTPIQKAYEFLDFERDWQGLPIGASVHIQVGADEDQNIAETLWVDEQIEESGFPMAIVAFADLRSPELDRTLDRQQDASARLRGIRQIVSRHPSEDKEDEGIGLLRNEAFARGLHKLAERGLSFDLQLTPPHLKAAAEVLRDIPSLKVALCHAGSPWDQTPEGLAQWKDGLSQLASCPNVTAKLSGLGMFDRQWTQHSLRPVVETVLASFGAARTMWGSNFPVDKLYHRYADMFGAVYDLVPTAHRDDVFGGTAARFYQLQPLTQPRRTSFDQ